MRAASNFCPPFSQVLSLSPSKNLPQIPESLRMNAHAAACVSVCLVRHERMLHQSFLLLSPARSLDPFSGREQWRSEFILSCSLSAETP